MVLKNYNNIYKILMLFLLKLIFLSLMKNVIYIIISCFTIIN
jgi:hypothetical protein